MGDRTAVASRGLRCVESRALRRHCMSVARLELGPWVVARLKPQEACAACQVVHYGDTARVVLR